ncbi:targeting for Xklp2 isoform X1 [Labeo rohita]|uniref:Targeting for Xklp2 isoform X1 n=1 Tax=Labeo rohita TaxID=84645 RepID=A0A498MGD7_LABRO|nr:targeting for Xklp2 isoform X1 [Labeo rohita]
MEEGSADAYTWDAPSHVIESIDDFALDPQDNADQWFELKAAPKSGTVKQLTTPLRTTTPFDDTHSTNRPKALVSPMVKEDKTTSSDVKESTSTEVAPNIVTSWGSGKTTAAPGQGQKTVPAQPRRVSKRPVPKNEKPAALTTPPLLKKRRSSTSQTVRRSGAGARRSVRLRTKPAIASKTADTASASNTTQQKSTEQQELERIEALQKEVAEQRRKNEASYRAALAGSHLPKKHVLSTTIPKEFNFRSDSRLKNHMDGASADDNSYKEVDFTSQLRKHPSSPLKAPKGTTIPKPFNLSRGKRKLDEAGAYVPMAQQIEEFQKRTPTRYHLRSRQSQERGPSPVKAEKSKITHPKTPQLLTRQRHRPTMVKSTAEIEAEEAEKLQQFKFKALELNRKILEGALVPKKPASKEVTKPEGFQLEIEKRLQERQATKKPEEKEDTTFHPRPLPTRILEEVVGVPEKKVLNPTVPESPAFALKNRVRMERKKEEEKPPAPIKAHPVPHFLPFQPKLPVKSQVEMCPFSFEERERERRVMKEKKLEEMRNEEVPKFKAQPLPDFHEVHLPEKKVLEATKPAPFKLMVDERGAAKGERWEQMMKEELKRQAEAACFKARPNSVVHKEPFVPKKDNRSILANSKTNSGFLPTFTAVTTALFYLTISSGPLCSPLALSQANTTNSAVPEGFQLATERRAKERMEFEKELSEKEALRARMEEERAREKEEQEKEEIARLRQEQHNLYSMSVKGSMKCPVPPSSPTTLEAKVDDLRIKVEQLLLSPERSCPMCGTCVQHRTLQETVTSQLSAQTRLLDSLEKKVLEMRTALEELARGTEPEYNDV